MFAGVFIINFEHMRYDDHLVNLTLSEYLCAGEIAHYHQEVSNDLHNLLKADNKGIAMIGYFLNKFKEVRTLF